MTSIWRPQGKIPRARERTCWKNSMQPKYWRQGPRRSATPSPNSTQKRSGNAGNFSGPDRSWRNKMEAILSSASPSDPPASSAQSCSSLISDPAGHETDRLIAMLLRSAPNHFRCTNRITPRQKEKIFRSSAAFPPIADNPYEAIRFVWQARQRRTMSLPLPRLNSGGVDPHIRSRRHRSGAAAAPRPCRLQEVGGVARLHRVGMFSATAAAPGVCHLAGPDQSMAALKTTKKQARHRWLPSRQGTKVRSTTASMGRPAAGLSIGRRSNAVN